MIKRIQLISLLSVLMLATACIRENLPMQGNVAEGTPVSMTIGFGATLPVEVRVGTKAEATPADESRVHDLYVFVFDNAGKRSYGRFFSYEHKWNQLSQLSTNTNENEGWYVRNKTMDGVVDPETQVAVTQTVGAVKIATTALDNCTLVLLANVSNALVSLGGQDPLDALNAVSTLSELRDLPVRLEQNVVERNDLFLMTGEIQNLNMTGMRWDMTGGTPTGDFGTDYRVTLRPLDAKVKFRIKVNDANLYDLSPNKWSVSNVPSSCYLFPTNPATSRTSYAFPSGSGHFYFDSEPAYFDAEEDGWRTFTFYMLESCLSPSTLIDSPDAAASYYLREKRENGAWTYAPARAPYVTFSVSMSFLSSGIDGVDDKGPDGAKWNETTNPKPVGATGEMTYTVHLGDFSHTDGASVLNANDYNTRGGYFYTYDITLNNAANLYAEVKYFTDQAMDVEAQPGQEGALLLYSGGVVNCDAHYEYRMIEFKYSANLAQELIDNEDYHIYSWSVKTPFTADGKAGWNDATHRYETSPDEKIDYLWVKFGINHLESGTDPKASTYSEKRLPYPGLDAYHPDWYPGQTDPSDPSVLLPVPDLLDINQLINYIYYQHRLKIVHDETPSKPVDAFDSGSTIRVTAFVDEYYYESDPFTGEVNPDLWRRFVNAEPREMHILSDVQSSGDGRSHLINASHSIIQRSIQSIYNVDAPDLTSVWGAEHLDEMRETDAWGGWEWGIPNDASISANTKSIDNGRLNSVALWGLYPAPDDAHDEWTDFLNYAVINTIPELNATHRMMAYSCLTRNRDNNGDGKIDAEELRWYMASINQLKGMWVGNESLSTTARVYQPFSGGDWRSHVISSTCTVNSSRPKVLNAEEGVATFDYEKGGYGWAEPKNLERKRESVRCVRNVGTYQVGSAPFDISFAPYGQIPDNYYTLETNKDPEHPSDAKYDSYTFNFNRLDQRSLREYTEKDLPFHDEKSSNNRVYLELHAQSRASRETETPTYLDGAEIFTAPHDGVNGLDMGDINEDITNEGYNKYCPPGFRLPNQKEMAMLTLALSKDYWGDKQRIPSRTYFSHGRYAPEAQRITSEVNKLGFCYAPQNTNIFLPDRKAPTRDNSSAIRCVRDADRTGTISGRMFLSSTRLMPGEQTTLNFNFSSAAAALTAGTLYLCYNDEGGHLVEREIPLAVQPDGLNYRVSQPFVAPDPESLTPSAGAPPADMHLKLVLSNVRTGSEAAFYTYFTVADVSISCDFEILPGSDETLGFPIRVHASTIGGDEVKIATLELLGRTDGDWTVIKTIDAAVGRGEYESTVYFKPTTLTETTYFFKLRGVSNTISKNTLVTSPKAMQFIKVDYRFNQDGAHEDVNDPASPYHLWTDDWWQNEANAFGWHNALVGNVPAQYKGKEQNSVICNKWQGQRVVDLDFSRGDFIEADMDLANCTYIKTVEGDPKNKPYKDQNIGLDNIIAFGTKGVDWIDETMLFYYPAHVSDGNDQLQVDPVVLGSYDNPQIGQVPKVGDKRPLVLLLDKSGFAANGAALVLPANKKAKYDQVLSRLLASKALYIGAEEGAHFSRATYNYVRVVRCNLSDVSDEVGGGFNGDPQNGGNL